MKMRNLLMTVTALSASLIAAGLANAAAPKADQPAKTTAADKAVTTGQSQAKADQNVQETPAEVVLTGSHIPQKAKQLGRITTGHSPVTVMDQKDIRRSGAFTVNGVLARDPAIFIRRGHR